ncbi:hypothetical protein POSPLADRAFT_1036166 [Postia placenta MAD-698-R-SB12]|uniref:C2H2-type domain-containing protein n=1 Tax=Postia placenta MAD-698-R-SB12 TaxID=670580 RepID=A0A1X6MQI2_9APHY|nr:hypothetical protein POSPLADRAFT_1036166 [Postia placenta MAD-698-R-SB12]OSX58476.1 hypothetical protein POSPLADRAFT_1036166 [Postia placenta MAD-698-R-SB12]
MVQQQHCKGCYCNTCEEAYASQADLKDHYAPSAKLDESRHFFNKARELREHFREEHCYCGGCRRVFASESNLRAHCRSSIHKDATTHCVSSMCHRSFVSVSAMILHLEAGRCEAGLDREEVDERIIQGDEGHVITNPVRLLERNAEEDQVNPQRDIAQATEHLWDGSHYKCPKCRHQYVSFAALKRLLASPAHATKIYRCPPSFSGCGAEFGTLSALAQHVENEQCGIHSESALVAIVDLCAGKTRSQPANPRASPPVYALTLWWTSAMPMST